MAIVLVALGGGGWAGHWLTALHYEALIAKDKDAQSQAVQTAKDSVISDLKLQMAATQAAEKKYDDLKASNDALAQRFTDSLSNYAALRGDLVSATSTATSIAHAAAEGPCSDPELARLSGEAVKAALDDAAEVVGLQTWANGLRQ